MTHQLERPGRRVARGWIGELAAVALAAYDLPPVRLTLLSHYSNTTFRVDTTGGQRYVLRIHRGGTPTVASVGAELAWLSALRRDTARARACLAPISSFLAAGHASPNPTRASPGW